jgi:hypothetical protein
MFADQSLQFESLGIQSCLEQINTEMNTSDSLVTTTLSDINANLSAINANLVASNQNSFLGVSWDILLPAIISILVFVLGYYITSLLERRKIQKGRNLVRDAIVTWADSNSENLEKYVKSIRDLAEGIGNSDNISPQEFHIQHITIDVLSQFSIDRLTDALVSGLPDKIEKKGENLNAYMQSVSYLIRTQKIVLDIYDEYCSRSNDIFMQWSNKWRAFTHNCEMNNMRLHLQPPINPEKIFYLKMSHTIKSHLNDGSGFAEYGNIMAEIKQLFDTVPIQTNEIITSSYVFGDLYVTMIQSDNMKQYKQSFMDCAERIKNAVDLFQNAVNFYREQKMNYWA